MIAFRNHLWVCIGNSRHHVTDIVIKTYKTKTVFSALSYINHFLSVVVCSLSKYQILEVLLAQLGSWMLLRFCWTWVSQPTVGKPFIMRCLGADMIRLNSLYAEKVVKYVLGKSVDTSSYIYIFLQIELESQKELQIRDKQISSNE